MIELVRFKVFKVLHEKFQFWGEGDAKFNSKSSMRSSNFGDGCFGSRDAHP